MTDLFRSELLKLRSTRTTLGLLLGMLAFVAFVVLISGYSQVESGLVSEGDQRNLLSISGVGTLFAALLGIMVVTTEFRHGTIRPTLVFAPRRARLIAAKLAASLLAGAVFGVAANALALGGVALVLSTRGIPLALGSGEILRLVAGSVGATALLAGLGLGLGAIVRSQVGSMIGLLAWFFIGENILFGLRPHIGRYSPGIASQALAGTHQEHVLAPLAGGLVLCVWVAALFAAGAVLTVRRDVD